MTRFTDSPYEKMMTNVPQRKAETPCAKTLPPNHPCYGCGNYTGKPCVGLCTKEMNAWLNERRKPHEAGHC